MPDRIYVTYTPTSVPDAFHTAVHYERRDVDGNLVKHLVIEVQPEAKGFGDKAIGVIEEAFRTGTDVTRLGRMKARVVDLTKVGFEEGVDPNAPYEEIAAGDDLRPHLARMQRYADEVNRAGIAYRGWRQNSNSFASGALQTGELPSATGIGRDPIGRAGDLLEFFVPGLNEPLEAPTGWGASTFDSRSSKEPALLDEHLRYLRRVDKIANNAAAAPTGANASPPFGTGGQFVPGSAASSRPLYETRSFVAPSGETVPADTRKDIRRLVRLPIRKEDLAGFDPNAPAAAPNEIPPAERPTSFDDRFGNWTSFSGVSAPLAPNQPVAASPQAGRPLGLLTGKPMPDYPFPPPILGFSGKSSKPGDEDWVWGLLRRAEWDKKAR